MNQDKINKLVIDLRVKPPRSPRELLGDFVILARCIDKCRAFLVGKNGEYNFWPCSLCEQLEKFSGVNHDKLKEFVSTGVSDNEVAHWFQTNSKIKDKVEIIRWNNKMRDMRLSEMEDFGQEYLEEYISKNLPKYPPVYVWFDVYDIEEGRLT